MKIGILIYDDNDHLRESLKNLISVSPDLLLLGSFPRADDVVNQITSLNPDVVLMDIDMPAVSGIEAVKRIRSSGNKVEIIMLTIFEDSMHILDSICAGASGYLLKKHISGQLSDSIHSVMKGEAPMSTGIAKIIFNRLQVDSKPAENIYNLTRRENEILGCLSKGDSYKIIAANLAISIDTVRAHIKKIYEKLQVHTQTEAVSKAIHEKLI